MSLKTTKALAAAALDAILATINSGGDAGSIKIYTGSAPSDLATAATGTLLSTAPLVDGSQNAFGSTNTTTLVATGYTSGGKFAEDTNVANTATAGYFRLCDKDGVAVLQGGVGTSGADLNLTTTSLTAGDKLTITAMSIQMSGIT